MTFLSTLAGILGAIALFVYAITTNTDNYLMFLSPSSVAMVFGGTAAATIAAAAAAFLGAARRRCGAPCGAAGRAGGAH